MSGTAAASNLPCRGAVLMARRARMLVPQTPSAVARVRNQTMTYIRSWGGPLSDERQEAVKLVVSELVTNAIVHAGGRATVGLYYDDCCLLVVVRDNSSTQPRRAEASAEAESGRGLVLVNALAERNGWAHTQAGKKVWAEFETSGPRAATGLSVVRRRRVHAIVANQYDRFSPKALMLAAVL
ncbi:ATP-binding protein [Streptomyces sp. NPDC051597]|uniref:ATP-binding protein n=1 Tax=Streptomyces sp. NPDC051597 TaxID=3155049 RepID=UPI0034214799